MFTGLIQNVGKISELKNNSHGREFYITTTLASEIKIDDSVATNGVCLTATKVTKDGFYCQAVPMTLKKTTLGDLHTGDPVNLELALRYSDRLGGHLVQGHVSDVGVIQKIHSQGEAAEFTVEFPRELRRYMILEGSIAIDGISLTIASLNETSLTLAIIPHTLDNTHLSRKKVGDRVNIEVDMVAKFVENMLSPFMKKTTSLPFKVKYED
jgi:riboflavin synthase